MSLVNSDRCLHFSPYLKRSIGIMARARLSAAKQLNPHPRPKSSVKGRVHSGKKVPARHLVTTTPVIADAEYSPQASTMYACTGIIVKRSEKSTSATDARMKYTGNWYSATHPYAAIENGSAKPPRMVSGSRYSGLPFSSSEPRNAMYILSRLKLQTKTANNDPMPTEDISDARSESC